MIHKHLLTKILMLLKNIKIKVDGVPWSIYISHIHQNSTSLASEDIFASTFCRQQHRSRYQKNAHFDVKLHGVAEPSLLALLCNQRCNWTKYPDKNGLTVIILKDDIGKTASSSELKKPYIFESSTSVLIIKLGNAKVISLQNGEESCQK